MKEQFWKKISSEYLEYKHTVLLCTNTEIYGKSYEIDMMINLYEILMEIGEKMSDRVLAALLSRNNILLTFYNSWLKKDDGVYDEIESHVTAEIRKLAESQDNIRPDREGAK